MKFFQTVGEHIIFKCSYYYIQAIGQEIHCSNLTAIFRRAVGDNFRCLNYNMFKLIQKLSLSVKVSVSCKPICIGH